MLESNKKNEIIRIKPIFATMVTITFDVMEITLSLDSSNVVFPNASTLSY